MFKRKVVSLKRALEIRQQSRKLGKPVVFTNGCFDVLHAGHLVLLKKARALGDVLFVGLNSDASIALTKGRGRPIMSQGERSLTLSLLDWVDYIVIFDQPTAEELVGALKPDIYVKGGDYAVKDSSAGKPLPEAEIVLSNGGRVELIPLLSGFSTTSILKRMKEEQGGQANPISQSKTSAPPNSPGRSLPRLKKTSRKP